MKQVGALEELGSLSPQVRAAATMPAPGRLERSLQFAEMAREIAASTHDVEVRSWLAMEAEPWFYKGLWQRTVRGCRAELIDSLGKREVERCIVGVGLGSHRLSEAKPDFRRKGLFGSGDEDSGAADR